MENFNKKVGQRVYELRIKNKYTREYLAEIADISDNFLYEIETGRKGFSAITFYQLSQSLNVTMDYLATGEKPTSESNNISELLMIFNEKDRKIVLEIILKISKLSK